MSQDEQTPLEMDGFKVCGIRNQDREYALQIQQLCKERDELRAQCAALRTALEQEHIKNSDGLDLLCHTGHCSVCDLIDATPPTDAAQIVNALNRTKEQRRER